MRRGANETRLNEIHNNMYTIKKTKGKTRVKNTGNKTTTTNKGYNGVKRGGLRGFSFQHSVLNRLVNFNALNFARYIYILFENTHILVLFLLGSFWLYRSHDTDMFGTKISLLIYNVWFFLY